MWSQISRLSKILQPFTFNSMCQNVYRNFSIFQTNPAIHGTVPRMAIQPLLQTTVLNIIPQCGLKQVGRVKRRCKDCYLVVRQERLYNICKTHPRHKQMAMKKKPKNTWILTDATQSRKRAW